MVEMCLFEKAVVNSKLYFLFHKHKWFGISKLLDMTGHVRAKKILELGCGVGITTTFIASKFREAKVTAMDYDAGQIGIAKRKQSLANVEFVVGDAAKLDFKPRTFDVVFESLAFHHILGYEKAIREAYRVLKPGGLFYVLDTPFKSIPFSKLIWFEPVKFTRSEFVRELNKAGFIVNQNKGRFLLRLEAQKPFKPS